MCVLLLSFSAKTIQTLGLEEKKSEFERYSIMLRHPLAKITLITELLDVFRSVHIIKFLGYITTKKANHTPDKDNANI